jgi:hypothetical protein
MHIQTALRLIAITRSKQMFRDAIEVVRRKREILGAARDDESRAPDRQAGLSRSRHAMLTETYRRPRLGQPSRFTLMSIPFFRNLYLSRTMWRDAPLSLSQLSGVDPSTLFGVFDLS